MTYKRSSRGYVWLMCILVALLLLTVAAPTLPVQTALAHPSQRPVAATTYAIYTVQAGDTLAAIARRASTTVNNLVALNRLTNANQIRVGQTLLVPAAVENRGSTANYTVRRSDTLYSLARTYNTTVGVLMWLNGITNPNRIRVGQRLLVPSAGGTGEPAPVRIRFPAGGTSATVTGTRSAQAAGPVISLAPPLGKRLRYKLPHQAIWPTLTLRQPIWR